MKIESLTLVSNTKNMDSTQIRSEIHQIIDQIDESFLNVVHSMLETYMQQKNNPIIGYDSKGNALYAEEMKEVYAERISRIKNGEFTSVEDLRKESVEW